MHFSRLTLFLSSPQAAVFINVFVVSVFAAGFYGTAAADAVGLQNAGQYLGDTYGSMATYIWALGLLAAGQSSTMTGCYCGCACVLACGIVHVAG